MLDSIDIEILLAIQKNPMATISEIANQINMSISNTSARIDKLENEYEAFKRVHADLNLPALDLEHHDFFIQIKSKKSLYLMEQKFAYYHPYLSFRDRCNGKLNGLFIQFRSPKGSLVKITALLDKLVKKDLIDNFWHIPADANEIIIRSNSALDYWDRDKKQWVFDWDKWKEGFNGAQTTLQPITKPVLSIMDQLSELDIKLLTELTSDARKKNVDMIRNIGLKNESGTAQKISRRVRFLKENAISNYRLNLSWKIFDLFHSLLIQGQCDKLLARKIRNYLMNSNQIDRARIFTEAKFPFPCFFKITENGFLWYIRAPPTHLSQLLDFVWDICPEYNLYLLSYKYSQVYSLWDQTFDSVTNYWKSSDDFMIDNVLDQMLK